MGPHAVTSYIRRHNLGTPITFSSTDPTPIVLACDLSSFGYFALDPKNFLREVPKDAPPEPTLLMMYGGELQLLEHCVRHLIERFKKCGIDLIFVQDTRGFREENPLDQYEGVAKKMREQEEMVSWVKNRSCDPEKLKWACHGKGHIMRSLGQEYGKQYIVGEFIADVELAKLVTSGQAHAVMSDDADFVIMEGCRWIPFSMMEFTDAGINAVVIEPKELAQSLHVHERWLPHVAAATGNDFTGPFFHKMDLPTSMGTHGKVLESDDGQVKTRIFPADAASWLRRQLVGADDNLKEVKRFHEARHPCVRQRVDAVCYGCYLHNFPRSACRRDLRYKLEERKPGKVLYPCRKDCGYFHIASPTRWMEEDYTHAAQPPTPATEAKVRAAMVGTFAPGAKPTDLANAYDDSLKFYRGQLTCPIPPASVERLNANPADVQSGLIPGWLINGQLYNGPSLYHVMFIHPFPNPMGFVDFFQARLVGRNTFDLTKLAWRKLDDKLDILKSIIDVRASTPHVPHVPLYTDPLSDDARVKLFIQLGHGYLTPTEAQAAQGADEMYGLSEIERKHWRIVMVLRALRRPEDSVCPANMTDLLTDEEVNAILLMYAHLQLEISRDKLYNVTPTMPSEGPKGRNLYIAECLPRGFGAFGKLSELLFSHTQYPPFHPDDPFGDLKNVRLSSWFSGTILHRTSTTPIQFLEEEKLARRLWNVIDSVKRTRLDEEVAVAGRPTVPLHTMPYKIKTDKFIETNFTSELWYQQIKRILIKAGDEAGSSRAAEHAQRVAQERRQALLEKVRQAEEDEKVRQEKQKLEEANKFVYVIDTELVKTHEKALRGQQKKLRVIEELERRPQKQLNPDQLKKLKGKKKLEAEIETTKADLAAARSPQKRPKAEPQQIVSVAPTRTNLFGSSTEEEQEAPYPDSDAARTFRLTDEPFGPSASQMSSCSEEQHWHAAASWGER